MLEGCPLCSKKADIHRGKIVVLNMFKILQRIRAHISYVYAHHERGVRLIH